MSWTRVEKRNVNRNEKKKITGISPVGVDVLHSDSVVRV